jgi:TatD DNase family protein
MIDTHAHLNFEAFKDDLLNTISRASDGGLEAMIVPGSNIENSMLAVRIAEENQPIYAAAGIHPCHVSDVSLNWQYEINEIVAKPKVVAVGEVGFDFIRRDEYNPKLQRQVLQDIIAIANKKGLPVIFHSRESEDELLEFIQLNKPKHGSVLHCFCANKEIAFRALDLGMYISFTGMITYPKNDFIREIISLIPHERVMVETDSPYLPPQTKRGQRCEPLDVFEVIKTIGQCWKKDVEYVDNITSSNAREFFNINT